MKCGFQRSLAAAVLLAAGSAMAVEDLPWIDPEPGALDRDPVVAVSEPSVGTIDTRPSFTWESIGSDLFTFPWGILLLVR